MKSAIRSPTWLLLCLTAFVLVVASAAGAATLVVQDPQPVAQEEGDSLAEPTERLVDTSQSDGADVRIEDEISNASGSTAFIVRFESVPPPRKSDRSAVVNALKRQANTSHQPLISLAEGNPHISIEKRFWLLNGALVEADLGKLPLERLTELPGVEWIHPNYQVDFVDPMSSGSASPGTTNTGLPMSGSTATDTATVAAPSNFPSLSAAGSWETTYGLAQANVTPVWDEYGQGTSDVTVAVLDTGADAGHEDITVDAGWKDFTHESCSNPCDGNGHGTHVHGTVNGGNASGTWIGVAPGIQMAHGKIFDSNGASTSLSNIANAMEWAVDTVGADVMSNSWGASSGQETLIEPIQNARIAGTLPVVASGNQRAGEPIGSPSDIYGSVNVGATQPNGYIVPFSSGNVVNLTERWDDPPSTWRTWPSEMVVPTLAAPGVSVDSARSGSNTGLVTYSGTSMATPHVSGALGLLLSYRTNATADGALEALRATAWRPAPSDEDSRHQDLRYGNGAIDVYRAMQYQPMSVSIASTNAPVQENETLSVDVQVTNEGEAAGTETVYFEYGDAGVVDEARVDLAAGDTTLVTFQYTPGPGEGDLKATNVTAFTYADAASTDLQVEPLGYFEVSNLDAAGTVGRGTEHLVEATITNDGTAEVTRTVEYRFGVGSRVAVAGTDTAAQDRHNLTESVREWVDPDLVSTVDEINASELVQVTEAHEYDVIVINDFDANAGEFVDALEGTGVGVVYLGGYLEADKTSMTSHALTDLSAARGNPREVTTGGDWGERYDDAIRYEITADHEILPANWQVGQSRHVYGSRSGDRASFAGYTGDVLANVTNPGVPGIEGAAIGVDDSRREVILTFGRSAWWNPPVGSKGTWDSQFTQDSNRLLANSIEYLAESIDTVEQEVTIGAGNSTVVEFRHQVDENRTKSTFEHGVATARDIETTSVEVVDSGPRFELDGLETPGGAGAGEELTVSTTVTNTGEAEGLQAIEFWFGTREAKVLVVDDQSSVATGLRDTIANEVAGNGDIATVDAATVGNLTDVMDGYDVFVLNSLDAQATYDDFLAKLDRSTQRVVLLDMAGVTDGGIRVANRSTGFLSGWETNSSSSATTTQLQLEADHELFQNVGASGDVVDVANTTDGEYLSFAGYDGTNLATVGNDVAIGPGFGVAVHDSRGEILLALGRGPAVGEAAFTADANAILGNAVTSLAADLDPRNVVGTTEHHLAGNESVTVSFNHTIDATHPDATVTHGISTDDAEVAEPFVVGPPDVTVDIVDVNDPIDEGGDLVVNATVANIGGVTADQSIDLDYQDDGSIESSAAVTLDHAETRTVTLVAGTEKGDWGDDVPVRVASENDTAATTAVIDEIDQVSVGLEYPAVGGRTITPGEFAFVPECHYVDGCSNASLWLSPLDTLTATMGVDTPAEWNDGRFAGTTGDVPGRPALQVGYQNGDAGDALQRYYRLDDATGSPVLDYSGEGVDATNEGATPGVGGVFDTTAYGFDGSAINATPYDVASAGTVTFQAWIRTDAAPVGGSTLGDAIVGWEGLSAGNGIFLGVSAAASEDQCASGELQWQVGNGTAWTAVCGPDVTDGAWHHVTATVDENGDLGLFVDGASVGSQPFDTFGSDLTETILLGATPGDTGDFNGTIDEVRIYDERRSPDRPARDGTASMVGSYDSSLEPAAVDDPARPFDWRNLTVNATVPTDTAVDLTLRAVSDTGDVLDEQVITIADGQTTYSLDLADSHAIETSYALQTGSAAATPQVHDVGLEYVETVATNWTVRETVQGPTNATEHSFVSEYIADADLPADVVWNVEVTQADGKVQWAKSNRTATVLLHPPPVTGTDPPQDLTGDRLYRDVIGDDQFRIFDVQAFFDNLDSDAVQEFPRIYNFAGFDADNVTIFDVQSLFGDLQEWQESESNSLDSSSESTSSSVTTGSISAARPSATGVGPMEVDDATEPDDAVSSTSIQSGENETSVSLSPSSRRVTVDETVEYDVVVDNPDNGINAYSIDLSLSDGSVASITDFTYAKQPQFPNSNIAPDGNSMELNAGQGDNVFGPGTGVTIATIELTAESTGQTNFGYGSVEISNNDNEQYSITGKSGGSLDVREPASFDVEVTGTNAPVQAGNELDVTATVENTGGVSATKRVEFSLAGSLEATRSLTLSSGESASVSASLGTTGLGGGSYQVRVSTPDDSDSTTVTIEPRPQPEAAYSDLTVSPTEGVAPVTVTANATVRNVGDTGTITVPLRVDGSRVDSATVSLGSDEATEVEFEHEQTEGGEFDVSIGDLAPVTVTLDAPQFLDVSITDTNAPILAGENLEVTATVENTGDVAAEQDISLSIAGVNSTTVPVALEPGAATSVTLVLGTTTSDFGDHEAVLSSVDDSDSRSVRIGEVVEPTVYNITIGQIPNLQAGDETVDVSLQIQSGGAGNEQSFTLLVNGEVVETGSMDIIGDELVTISSILSIDAIAAGGAQIGVESVDLPTAPSDDGTVSVEVTLRNTGGADGSETVTYDVGGETVDEIDVEVEANGTRSVTLEGELPEAVGRTAQQTVTVGESSISGTIVLEDGSTSEDGDGTTGGADADDGGPGFGILAAVLALLAALAVAVAVRLRGGEAGSE